MRALQLVRHVEVVRPLDELLRLHLDAVHVAREVHLAAARVVEQLEERGALLLGLRDELVGVAHVVLEPLLLLGRLAAPDPEEEEQQRRAIRPRPRCRAGPAASAGPWTALAAAGVAAVEARAVRSSRSSRKDKPRQVCTFRRTAWHPGAGRAPAGPNPRTCDGTTCHHRGAARHGSDAAPACGSRAGSARHRPGAGPLPAGADPRLRWLRRRVACARRAARARRRREGDPARRTRAAGWTAPSARRGRPPG